MRLGYSPTQGFNFLKNSGFNLFQIETTPKKKLIKKTMARTKLGDKNGRPKKG
jgi:hypothetical protein